MNHLGGRVVLKETGVGIPDLLVVIYDVDPGTTPEEASSTGEAVTGGGAGREGAAPLLAATATVAPIARTWDPDIGDRLGSRLTGTDGSFQFDYEDTEFQIRNPKEKRPDLLLMILAPEEPGVDEATRVLHVSSKVCGNTGRTEQRLIRLPENALKKAGVPLPIDPAIAKEQSKAVIGKLNQAITFHLNVESETKKIAAERIANERNQQEEITRAVEARVYESLTGVSSADAKRLRLVMPGEPVTPVMNASINNTIAKVNSGPLAGYLLLTETEAQQFSDGLGGYRENIPAEEIEPILYLANNAPRRPAFLLRDDPLEAICRAEASPDPFTDDTDGSEGTPTPPERGGTTADNAGAALTDLPKFVGRLIDGIAPPEDVVPRVDSTRHPDAEEGGRPTEEGRRPTIDDVQNSVHELQLKPGPADVARFYDFDQLQIAFDYVWQHAIDDGVIETTKQLVTQLVVAGGDPLGALRNTANPFIALRREAQNVMAAQGAMRDAGLMYKRATEPTTNGSTPTTTDGGTELKEPQLRVRKGAVEDYVATTGTLDVKPPPSPKDPLSLLEDLLNERYKFEVFAPGTTNFGLLVTYRQKWDPITYQVGELVKTLTLAPKETRKVTSKRVIKTELSVKEMQENQRNRKDETSETMRGEAEIVQKAQEKTHFDIAAKANYSKGGFSGGVSTTWSRDADRSSQETKKAFHEAVLKAAQEFKDTRKIEVETKTTEEAEFTETAEITNPNDELTVTYLFYELQQRFMVHEQIHRLRPVVMVAMEVPNPSRTAIDKVLLSHAWIIKRVLLDDRYRRALEYLCTTIVGDELRLFNLAQNVALASKAVATLQQLHADMQAKLEAREATFDAAVIARADLTEEEKQEGKLEKAYEKQFGSDDKDLEAMRMIEELRKDQYERAVREERELRMRLDSEIAALTTAQGAYAEANAQHHHHLLEIAGLRVHFKENLLYYMQAIWRYTFKDQLLFTLSQFKVPKITAPQKTYSLTVPETPPLSITPKPDEIVLEVRANVQLTSLDPELEPDFDPLPEITELEPIGFLGNFAVLPLKQSNPLTDYMMLPYLDTALGIHDPDDLASWTPEDFVKYARSLLKQFKEKLSSSEYQAFQNRLREQYRRIVSSPRRTNDEIIVPTTSLFIEALPGAHPLLENFKLFHRAVDVKKAQAETRRLELENLRYAGRLLDKEFDDPEIDRKIQITGAAPAIVVPPEA